MRRSELGEAMKDILVYSYLTYICVLIFGLKAIQADIQRCECGCPDGWTTFKGSCYMFGHGTNMTFVEAQHYCQQHHGDLVDVNSADENLFLKDYLSKLGGFAYYIGLTDEAIEGIWEWYDNNERNTFFDWGPSEPNGGVDRTNEDCVILSRGIKYQWADVPCYYEFQPLCEIRIVDGVNTIVG